MTDRIISLDLADPKLFQFLPQLEENPTPITIYKNTPEQSILRVQMSDSLLLEAKSNDPDEIGILSHPINLPFISTYYKFEIEAYANNDRTIMYIGKYPNQPFQKNYLVSNNESNIYLNQDQNSKYKFRFKLKHSQIRVGFIFGHESLVLPNDMILIKSIKIIPEISPTTEIAPIILSQAAPIRSQSQIPNQAQAQAQAQQAQEFTIKKVILEAELQDPNISLDLQTGDYVIVKTEPTPQSQTNHLYIKGHDNLEYVCNISSGLPNFFGSCLVPGKQIPTYDSRKEASKMLKTLGPEKFYQSDYWSGTRQKDDEIYLYLDPKGYVRWIRR